jgi:thioredoxin reductase (NADPH)
MSEPLLVAVDDDPGLLRDVERELRNRYAADYRVRCVGSASEARVMLQELAAAGEEVALVLAGEELSEASGTELLAEVPSLFPHAQRVLLIGWGHLGDTDTGDAIFEAIARGRVDQYLVRPAPPPDEQFHQAVSSFLLAWAEARRRAPHTIDVVGETWSGRAYELREVLGRCAMPHRFWLAGSEEGAPSSLMRAYGGSRSSSCRTAESWRTPATRTSRGRRGRRSTRQGTGTTS